MKNILEILKDNSVELSDEQTKNIEKEVKENYKTIVDYENQKEKLDLAKKSADDTQKAFDDFKKGFEGVDVEELKKKVGTLEQTLSTQKEESDKKIKVLELDSILKSVSKEQNCIDFDLAKTQLNYEELLNSKNQKEDAEKAFSSLKESKPHLFEVSNKNKRRILPSGEDDTESKVLSLKDALKKHYNENED